MATIAPITPDYDGQQLAFTAAANTGDSIAFQADNILLVNNTSGASRTVTIPISGDVVGQAVPSREVICPTGQITTIRLGRQHVSSTTGLVEITYSSEVGLGIAVLNPPV